MSICASLRLLLLSAPFALRLLTIFTPISLRFRSLNNTLTEANLCLPWFQYPRHSILYAGVGCSKAVAEGSCVRDASRSVAALIRLGRFHSHHSSGRLHHRSLHVVRNASVFLLAYSCLSLAIVSSMIYALLLTTIRTLDSASKWDACSLTE